MEDMVKNVLADCIARVGDPTVLSSTDISYVGGGSAWGQGVRQAGQQRIAPMARPLNGTGCVVTLPATQGTVDSRGEQLLIGLDGIAILAANQTHADSLFDDGVGATFGCSDAITGVTLSASLITPPGSPCPADPALSGAPNCCPHWFGLSYCQSGQDGWSVALRLGVFWLQNEARQMARFIAGPIGKVRSVRWVVMSTAEVLLAASVNCLIQGPFGGTVPARQGMRGAVPQ